MTIDLVQDTIVTVPSAAAAWRLILARKWPSVKIQSSRRTSLEGIARAITEQQEVSQ